MAQTVGKTYDFNVIYNNPDNPFDEREDNGISLKFTCFLVEKMKTFGLKSGYYHDRDALPGKTIFSELFEVVKGSKWTIVIVSKGFSKNRWSKYSCQSAFKKLIDTDKGENLIPIGLGIDENEFPDMHGIAQKAWFGLTEKQWKSEKAAPEWEKIRRLVCTDQHHGQESQGLNLTEERNLVTQDSAAIQKEEEVYYKKVLRQCLAELVRHLEPTSTIDEMVSCDLLLDTQYTDIENYEVPSKKNRTIVNVMRTKDEAGYKIFKTILQKTKQDYCLRIIENKERECRETAATKVLGASEVVYEKGLPPNDSDEVDAKDSVARMVKPMDESNPIDYVALGSNNLAKTEPSLPRTTDGDDPPGSRSAEIFNEISDQFTSQMSLEPDCGQTMLEVTTQALPIADDASLEQVNTVIVPTIVESAEKSATPTNDIDTENCNERQGESNGNFADSGYPERSLNHGSVNKHSTESIEDTANDAVSLTDEEQTGSGDETVFETPPEEPNNQFSNDNPGETPSEEASDVAAGGDSPVVSQQLPLSQTAGPSVSNPSEIMVKESNESSQPSGSSVLRPLLPRMVRQFLSWYLQPECAFSSIPTLD